MTPMSLMEYMAIPNKTDQGQPARYLYERRLDEGKLYFDFVPDDSTGSIVIAYLTPLEIVTATTDNWYVMEECFLALLYATAYAAALRFGRDPADYKAQRDEAIAVMQSMAPEESDVYFEPGDSY